MLLIYEQKMQQALIQVFLMIRQLGMGMLVRPEVLSGLMQDFIL